MVDPDNRRPVDFDARARALSQPAAVTELMHDWRDGRLKLYVLSRALALRAAASSLFLDGSYASLKVEGAFAGHAVASLRSVDGHHVITVISRCPGGFDIKDTPHIPVTEWGETSVLMPRQLVGLSMRDVLGAGDTGTLPAQLRLQDILVDLPVALLEVK
jgi:(1->4)-alpha-D-glucan 1-alpha-D-glucosylmutase